jgi:uncharacterized protein (DUF2235 family)
MPKSMIFLFDGTGNDASEDRFSNVYAINQLIADRKTIKVKRRSSIKTQITFYLPGVGTKFTVRKASRFGGMTLPAGRQYIFGDSSDQLILRAYVNLSANYHPGDEIVIIGFSRGAAAARIFSRLVSDFGILSSDMLMHLNWLWHQFVVISKVRRDSDYHNRISILQGELRQAANKEVFHQPEGMPIKFMGLFDTVIGPLDNDIIKGVDFRDARPAKGVEHIVHLLSLHEVRSEFGLKRFDFSAPSMTNTREIWMPGVHSDVGGGYSENLISNVALLTMCDELKSLGDVAINQSAYDEVEAQIATKIRDRRFVINAEPYVLMRTKRDALFKQVDEIHPLHWHLINKAVIWKKESRPATYADRLNSAPPDSTDSRHQKYKTLKSKLDRWVAMAT